MRRKGARSALHRKGTGTLGWNWTTSGRFAATITLTQLTANPFVSGPEAEPPGFNGELLGYHHHDATAIEPSSWPPER